MITITDIFAGPHPHNPRRDLGDLTELADSNSGPFVFHAFVGYEPKAVKS